MAATETGSENAFSQGVDESNPDAGVVTTPDGVMTGVDNPPPPPPPPPGQQAPPPETPPAQTFTAKDIEDARKQERDKLYGTLETERTKRKDLEKVEKDRVKADEARQEEVEAEQRAAAEKEMDARQLVETRTAEFQAQLTEERSQREALEATLDQERRYVQLDRYKSERVAAVQDNILPELVDLVGGSTEQEIDSSIESLQARTASILGNVQSTVASVRQGMQGASVTAPPVGPMDTQQNQQPITAEQISEMTPQEYAQHREQLLGAVRQEVKQHGIYGARG